MSAKRASAFPHLVRFLPPIRIFTDTFTMQTGGNVSRGITFAMFLFVLAMTIPRGVSIMVPALLNTKYELLGNRSIISDGIVDYFNERSEVSRIMPCIASYLKMHFHNPDRISIFVANSLQNESSTIESFLIGLQLNTPSYIINDKLDPTARYNTSAGGVVLTDSTSSLDNVTSSYLYLCGRDCRFVVIMTSSFEDVESFLEEADNVVQLMWTLLVGDIVVLSRVQDAVVVAGSLSFVPDEICTPMAPVLLGRCEGRNWQSRGDVSTIAMNGCIVSLGFFESYPYASTMNDTVDIAGIEGTLMKEVIANMNGTPIFEEIDRGEDIFEEMEMEFNVSGGHDFIFGGIMRKPRNITDFTVPYAFSRIVWMIPVTPNVSLRGIIAPLSAKVWIAVVTALLFGAVAKVFFIRDITFLDIFGIVLGAATSTQPRRMSSRINYMSWVIFSFFLCQFYLATLAGQLMNDEVSRIQNMYELAESGLELGGLHEVKEIFETIDDTDDDTEEDDLLNYIREKFIVFEREEYLDRLADLKAGRDTSLALLVIVNVTSADDGNSNVYMSREPLAKYPLAPAVRRGLPYLDKINRKIQTLVRGGFVNFWARKIALTERFHKRRNDDDYRAQLLGLKQLIPGFLLLAMGYGLGGIFFILEIVVYPSKWFE